MCANNCSDLLSLGCLWSWFFSIFHVSVVYFIHVSVVRRLTRMECLSVWRNWAVLALLLPVAQWETCRMRQLHTAKLIFRKSHWGMSPDLSGKIQKRAIQRANWQMHPQLKKKGRTLRRWAASSANLYMTHVMISGFLPTSLLCVLPLKYSGHPSYTEHFFLLRQNTPNISSGICSDRIINAKHISAPRLPALIVLDFHDPTAVSRLNGTSLSFWWAGRVRCLNAMDKPEVIERDIESLLELEVVVSQSLIVMKLFVEGQR